EVFIQFSGGIAGFLSYDFAHELEKFSYNNESGLPIPLGYLEVFEKLLAYDHISGKLFLGGWFFEAPEAQRFFDVMSSRIFAAENFGEENNSLSPLLFTPEISLAEYLESIAKIQQELRMGNSYQVNFSQKWSARSGVSDFEFTQKLVAANPAPCMYFLERPQFSILSCSPERLFSLYENTIFTQPIAGTRKRGKTEQEDEILAEELLTNSKELAEHTMLVDLLRNDFGRVADFGTVKVQEFARIEKYATVMHLVSDIVAQISPEKSAL